MQPNRKRTLFLTLVPLAVVVFVNPVGAQYQWDDGWSPQPQKHKIEITPYVGYTWTSSIDARVDSVLGSLDIESSVSWGIELDINVKPGGQITLLYQRQDSKLIFQPAGALKQTLGDLTVEYFQFGGIGGVQKGKVMPFSIFTLGATRFAGQSPLTSDVWKFSLILGIGAKFYLSEHLGIRVQARLPWVLIDGGGAVACGGGGCAIALGGSGFVQPDVGVGLMLLF
ncbi:MAG: hypothetical protein JSW50_01015 [Candidatus Latescibacterota bacterium]|nr:MAG: hypothetical protein JSW50_01015 [Candidatus Latescibacterota bacterium]